jgi:hypothetical protein
MVLYAIGGGMEAWVLAGAVTVLVGGLCVVETWPRDTALTASEARGSSNRARLH